MIDAQRIIEGIKGSHDSEFEIRMADYLETKLRISSWDEGGSVYLARADFSDITGWRRVKEGSIEQMTKEIELIATFPGRIVSEEFNRDVEDEEE
jgi:hypothetical protein